MHFSYIRICSGLVGVGIVLPRAVYHVRADFDVSCEASSTTDTCMLPQLVLSRSASIPVCPLAGGATVAYEEPARACFTAH